MKIIIDNKIPYIKEAVQTIADEIIYAPGFYSETGTRRRCADYPDPYSLQSGITGRQPGKVYSYGNHRVRPYRY